MYRLHASVGRGGRNAHDDVKIVQKLLNKNAHLAPSMDRLAEHGILDAPTERAIEAFQRTILRLSAPDGRVDPHGRTLQVLLGAQAHGATGALAQLSAEPGELYLYASPDRAWATRATLASLHALATALAREGIVMGVGDIGFAHGGRLPPHRGHRRGVEVDLRPQRVDGTHAAVSIDDPQYSRSRTGRMVELLSHDPNLAFIVFSDRALPNVRFHEEHEDHLHLRFLR